MAHTQNHYYNLQQCADGERHMTRKRADRHLNRIVSTGHRSVVGGAVVNDDSDGLPFEQRVTDERRHQCAHDACAAHNDEKEWNFWPCRTIL
jgi:hypothetical protein